MEDAYKLLSDDKRRARYDQVARYNQLQKPRGRRWVTELMAYSSPRGSGSTIPREQREKYTVEESMPKKDLDEAIRFTDEP